MTANIESLLEASGVVHHGHFVFTEGDHADNYVRKDLVLANPELTVQVADAMSNLILEKYEPTEVDAVASIAPCASVIGSHVGSILSHEWDKPITTVFAEKVPEIVFDSEGKPKIVEQLRFKRGYDALLEDKNGIAVEDIITTGGTLYRFLDLLRTIPNFTIVGATALWNRSPDKVDQNTLNTGLWLPLVSKKMVSVLPEDCRQCDYLEANPIRTDLGHGKRFLAELAQLAAPES